MREPGTIYESGLIEMCDHLRETFPVLGIMYEIGSFAGESARIFSRYFSEVHCVDPWVEGQTEGGLDAEHEFDRLLAPQMRKHKAYSVEAAETVADLSIDFAYIDAEHSYSNVYADVQAWWPKVRLALAGHDWDLTSPDPAIHGDVNRAVYDFFHSLPEWTTARLFPDGSWLVRRL
jgi:hypothetical protein